MLVQQKGDHFILTDARHHNPTSVRDVSEVHKLVELNNWVTNLTSRYKPTTQYLHHLR